MLKRLFFALWPEPAWALRLLEAAAPVLAAPELAVAGGRAVAGADLHVTLCFLGAVGEAQRAALCERAGGIVASSFELHFERLEWWHEAGVLAATAAQVPAAGAELAAALSALGQQLELPPDARAWRPHVTLLRGVSSRRLPSPLLSALPALRLTLPARRFYLAESQGLGTQVCGAAEAARYATLASWPLRP